jgi:hypothetical protein
MMHPLNCAAAALIAIILSAAWQLDGPSDLDVMQLVAEQKQANQTDRLVLP